MILQDPIRAVFITDETGSMTVFGLFLAISFLMIGGYAIDLANVMTARTQLQVTVDATAHAALLTRELKPESEAKAKALAIAEANMPAALYGDILDEDNIEFGVWDTATRSFQPLAGSRQAVRVRVGRNTVRTNPVETYLLNLVGMDSWNLTRDAILVAYTPTCFNEGFVAEGVVDIQSNNNYYNGFCIHSNQHVELNNNNYFEPGTIVSMPNPDDIVLPNSGWEKNEGLLEALRAGSYNIRVLNRVEAIISGLLARDPRYLPADMSMGSTVTLTERRLDRGHFFANRLHRYDCGAGGRLTLEAGVYRDFGLVTNCEVRFNSGVVLENVIIATTNTGAKSISSASGLQVGRNDNCAPGGGSQLISLGGMDFPASLQMFGSQLIARGTIAFAAQANGIQGASMVAGGRIDGTSNMNMAFCGTGMEDNFQASYFRLVL